ncbi:MAG: OsmC family protein [Armatimonadetes bacterium]|nr:OsmC family protein [Armatimonadota bacterium]
MGETVKVDASLLDLDGMAFRAALPTGQELVMDAGEDHGGRNLGARPMHLLLAGLAGCTGMDVISFLRKMRQPVKGYRIEVEGERAEDYPKVFTHIRVRHIVTGDVDEERLAKAVELSESRYCSANAMLKAVAEIETTWEVERE